MSGSSGTALTVHAPAVVAILGMAVATLACRLGGYWLVRRLPPTRFVQAWLDHVPGCVFVALVAPAVLADGPPAWAAAVVAIGVSRVGLGFLPALLAALAAFVAVERLVPVVTRAVTGG